jgi:hypothetical protein
MEGDITNSDTIQAHAAAYASTDYDSSAYAYADVYGIGVDSLQGDIINDGTIDAWSSAQAYGSYSNADANAYGIDIYDFMDGDITNNDTIEAYAAAEAYSAYDSAYPLPMPTE